MATTVVLMVPETPIGTLSLHLFDRSDVAQLNVGGDNFAVGASNPQFYSTSVTEDFSANLPVFCLVLDSGLPVSNQVVYSGFITVIEGGVAFIDSYSPLMEMTQQDGLVRKFTANSLEEASGGTGIVFNPTFGVTPEQTNTGGVINLSTNSKAEKSHLVFDTVTLTPIDFTSFGVDMILVFEKDVKTDVQKYYSNPGPGEETLTLGNGFFQFTPTAELVSSSLIGKNEEDVDLPAALRRLDTNQELWVGSAKLTYVPDKD